MAAVPETTATADFGRAVSLAIALDFAGQQPQHFGAPPATSTAFRTSSFEGEVGRGASCNCSRITLVPHCNGTHTESACHLTVQQRPLHEFVPLNPMTALLLTLPAEPTQATDEDSDPPPRNGDLLITRKGLMAAWSSPPGFHPRALLLRTAAAMDVPNPPYISRQLMREIVARGIEHLVVNLPSVDRSDDDGKLTAHRIFFGLPAGSTDLDAASRAQATITELARFPDRLRDGPCAVQLQLPAFSGDAVPSRPLYLPLVAP